MKRFFRTFSGVLLTAVMAAGCAGNTAAPASSAAPEATPTSSEAAAPAESTPAESTPAESSPAESEAAEPAPSEDTSAVSGEKTIIKVTHWGDASTAEDPEKILIDRFNAENTSNIEIQYDIVPGDGYGDRLTTSFSSGEGYDIFASGEGDFYKWVKAGLARPMNDLIEKDTAWNNTMAESLYNMGNIEGNQYYLVRDYNPIALFYSKDVFDKNGVAYPTNTWTWDDLIEAAKKLTVKNDDGTYESYGFDAQSWEYAVLSYLNANGADIMSEDGTTVDGYLNSEKVAGLLDTYVSWAEGDDRISPTSSDMGTFGDSSAMMKEGALAMTLNGGWMRGSLEGSNYGTAIAPGEHNTYLCASAYAMSSRVANPDAAWEVMKLLTGEECNALKVEHSAVFPTVDSELENLKATADETLLGLMEQIDYSIQPAGARSPLGNPATTAFKEAFERLQFHDGATMDILNDAVAAAAEYAQ